MSADKVLFEGESFKISFTKNDGHLANEFSLHLDDKDTDEITCIDLSVSDWNDMKIMIDNLIKEHVSGH